MVLMKKLFCFCARRHDSSIGFGAPVRANMRTGGATSAAIASSLLDNVSLCLGCNRVTGSNYVSKSRLVIL